MVLDEFGLLGKNAWNQKKYTAPDALSYLDEAGFYKTIHDHHKETCADKESTGPVGTPSRKGNSKSKSNNSVVDMTNDTGDYASHTSLASGEDSNSSKERLHYKASNKDEESLSVANGG
jgi:hypothetical protein